MPIALRALAWLLQLLMTPVERGQEADGGALEKEAKDATERSSSEREFIR